MAYINYITAPLDIDGIVKNKISEEDDEDDFDTLEYSKKDLFLYGEIRVDIDVISGLC